MDNHKEYIRVSSGGDTHLNNKVVSSAKAVEVNSKIYSAMMLQEKACPRFHSFSLNEKGYADYKQYVFEEFDQFAHDKIESITQDWLDNRLCEEHNDFSQLNEYLEEEIHLKEIGGSNNG